MSPSSQSDVKFVWYRQPGQPTLSEGHIFRSSDSTLHWIQSLVNPPKLHILPVDRITGEPSGPQRTLELEAGVTVQYFRKNHPGSYICAYNQGIAFLDESTGKLDILKKLIPDSDSAMQTLNDGSVDCMGRFWVGEIDLKMMPWNLPQGLPADYKPAGRLWRYDPDGVITQMDDGISCGNGITWSPDNKTMYFCDTLPRVIWAYDFDASTGQISNKRVFHRVDTEGAIGPDGMCIDVNGNIWVALFGAGTLTCIDPSGNVVKTVTFAAKNITCPTWGGAEHDELYVVTSAALNPNIPLEAGDEGGHIFKYKPGIKGVQKHEFAG